VPVLEHDEKTIATEDANHKGASGKLTLTNKRLVFEHASGILSKRNYTTLNLPLDGIENFSVEGAFMKKLAVYAKKGYVGSFPMRLEFSVREPNQWQYLVSSALNARIETIETERKRERVQIVLDFTALKEYMGRGGLALQTTRCPECGAPLRLPESGNQIQCQHCGNTLQAQDIFEKIKSLI
jgi:hypothetical protein